MIDAPNTLNALIEELAKEGTLDSKGAFTIPLDKAQEKLRQFQLLDPSLYVLNLVAAAVAGGARRLEIFHTAAETTFEYDGASPVAAQLEKIFDHLASSGDRALNELAVAVNAALAMEPSVVIVEASGLRLELEASQRRVTPLSGNTTRNRVQVRGIKAQGNPWLTELLRLSPGPCWEESLLRACRYAPLELFLNRKRLGLEAVVIPGNVRLFQSADAASGAKLPPIEAAPGYQFSTSRASGDFAAALFVGSDEQDWGLTFVVNGVAFSRPATTLGIHGVGALVAAPFLRKNLSHSDLLEDERYDSLLEELRSLFEDFFRHLCAKHYQAAPPESGLQRGALWAAGRLADRGETVAAGELESWVWSHRTIHPSPWPPGLWVRDLAHDEIGQRTFFTYLRWLRLLDREPQALDRICSQAFQNGLLRSRPEDSQELRRMRETCKGLPPGLTLLAFYLKASERREELTEWFRWGLGRFGPPGSWATLLPMVVSLPSDVVRPQLEALVTRQVVLGEWSVLVELLEAAHYLSARSGEQWFHNWFSSVVDAPLLLGHAEALRGWLQERGHESELAGLRSGHLQAASDELRGLLGPGATAKWAQWERFLGLLRMANTMEAGRGHSRELLMLFGPISVAEMECLQAVGPWARHRLGLLLRLAGKPEESAREHRAADDILKSSESSRAAARSCTLLGDLELAGRRLDQAETHYRRALELDPSRLNRLDLAGALGMYDDGVHRTEALRLLQEEAAKSQALEQYLMLDQLQQVARGTVSFTAWVGHRARASLARGAVRAEDGKVLALLSEFERHTSDLRLPWSLLLAKDQPVAFLCLVQRLRSGGFGRRADELLCRYRLWNQLELDGTHPLRWAPGFRDS